MDREHDIYKIIDSITELFPTCRVWQRSQIGVTPENWSFSLSDYKNSNLTVLVDNGKCTIAISMDEYKELNMNKRFKKSRHKEVMKAETPEEIALLICNYFIKVQSEENEQN